MDDDKAKNADVASKILGLQEWMIGSKSSFSLSRKKPPSILFEGDSPFNYTQ